MSVTKPSDLAKIAMNIEKSGLQFYTILAEKTQDPQAKALFVNMGEEEKVHYDTFEKIFSRLSLTEIPELRDDDFEEYVQELVNNHVFGGDVNVEELAGEVNDPIAAIKLALDFEKDSILFFLQFKNVLLPEEQSLIQELIDEENKHIKRLLTVKRMLTSTREDFYMSQKTGDAEK